MTDFGRSGAARGPGSFSRGRGGAGANRDDGGYSRPSEGANGSDFVGHNPSFSQQHQQFPTSQGVSHQGYQTSQGLPQHQGYQTSIPPQQHQGYQTSIPPPQQSSYHQTSQGYSSGQQGEMRSQPAAFDRSRSGTGASFSRGQGSQSGFARPTPPMSGAVHQMGGQAQQQVLGGGPDSNDDWRKKQEEAIARNMNILVQETPAKKLPIVQEVVTIEPEIQIQLVGVVAEHSRVERIPAEPIIRHSQENVTHPSSLSRPIVQPVQTQNVPSGAAVGGLISSVTGAASKNDMEKISEIVGLMAEAFHKLDIFIKSKK